MDNGKWNRRQFVVAGAAFAAAALTEEGQSTVARATKPNEPIEIYIVPNFHPASCGWLMDFSRERIYCANTYLNHLDRVRDDPDYAFVLSEANNILAIRDFHPERIPELKQRLREGRVELVNAYFLESTINLSGGESLVRLGVEGIRWFEAEFGVRPRFSWNIDTCGTHEQMAQIARGLGLEALVYTRSNPTDKALFWTESPDGSRILTLVPGSYSRAKIIFRTQTPLTDAQFDALEIEFEKKQAETPEGIPGLVLGGSGDYSRAPLYHNYPAEFLAQWQERGLRKLRFGTLSEYFDAILPAIKQGTVQLPTHTGGTAYTYGAFWIENERVKTSYRQMEARLAATEVLGTVASLSTLFQYPSQDLYDCWILMFLNMDRDTLWGGAAEGVYESKTSWDVADRFQWVHDKTGDWIQRAGESLITTGDGVAFFNRLNWTFDAPVMLSLPAGKTLGGHVSEQLPDGRVLLQLKMPPMSMSTFALADSPLPAAHSLPTSSGKIETPYYRLRIDQATGGIVSLRSKGTGKEFLNEPANALYAERPLVHPDEPGDHMPPTSEQRVLGSSNDRPSQIHVSRGAISTLVEITGTFQGAPLRRTLRLYHKHPRIDCEVELNDVSNYTVVYAAFPLGRSITEVRRGIPYGFSFAPWNKSASEVASWAKGIVPAVRWIDFQLKGGGGLAILDRGLSGRELSGNTPIIYLMNAEDTYWAYPSPWTSGKGKHILQYALLPHDNEWPESRIPYAAWEYNEEPMQFNGRSKTSASSYLETSQNVIVEAMHRENDYIEIRLVECFGRHGEAELSLRLPHTELSLTDFTGRVLSTYPRTDRYRFPIRPLQIVTLHFRTKDRVVLPDVVARWDQFAPKQKLGALHAYDPNLSGHPPFGDHPYTFP